MKTIEEKKRQAHSTCRLKGNTETVPDTTLLVVGEVFYWVKSGRSIMSDSQIVFTDFSDVSASVIEVTNPSVILSPLLCTAFDCIDLGTLLNNFGYSGRYRIMAPSLPDPEVILSENKELCPVLDVDFIYYEERPFARAC